MKRIVVPIIALSVLTFVLTGYGSIEGQKSSEEQSSEVMVSESFNELTTEQAEEQEKTYSMEGNLVTNGGIEIRYEDLVYATDDENAPELIKSLVQKVNGTIVECNTAYGGSRSSTAMHYQVANDHGFTAIADFKLLDENGSMTLPVIGGTRLKENYVGAAFADYDSYLVLSHFKGHSMVLLILAH